MSQIHRPHIIASKAGQPKPRATGPVLWTTLLLGLLALTACHRLPGPGQADSRLPAAFRSPEATFDTWMRASLARDQALLSRCYWPGLVGIERQAWLQTHLSPEARSLFQGARWLAVSYRSPVEANFSFISGNGDEIRGVMVRTGEGWKIQSW